MKMIARMQIKDNTSQQKVKNKLNYQEDQLIKFVCLPIHILYMLFFYISDHFFCNLNVLQGIKFREDFYLLDNNFTFFLQLRKRRIQAPIKCITHKPKYHRSHIMKFTLSLYTSFLQIGILTRID